MNKRSRPARTKLSAEACGRIMQVIRECDTRPEMFVRRDFHAAGLRFRLHPPALPYGPQAGVFVSEQQAEILY